jgi:succinate dehydrogenase / fumarate reductase iron-sulfur subunit
MKFQLKIWRQTAKDRPGNFIDYEVNGITEDMSFLEMLDSLNEQITKQGSDPVQFDNDCREGICGMCSLVINGQAHGPGRAATTCQVYMRKFKDGDTITIEPWRAKPFPVVRDLVVDRSSLDRIIQAGGYVSTKTGPHPDGNAIPIPKDIADRAMDAAACIGCGACVAACPNASSSLFTAAKITQFALLPQGHSERYRRVTQMVDQMDREGFGNCSNIGECHAACPKEISIEHIAVMKREYFKAALQGR